MPSIEEVYIKPQATTKTRATTKKSKAQDRTQLIRVEAIIAVLEEYPDVFRCILDNWSLVRGYLLGEKNALPEKMVSALQAKQIANPNLFGVTLGPKRKITLGDDLVHAMNFFSERTVAPSFEEVEAYLKTQYQDALMTISAKRGRAFVGRKTRGQPQTRGEYDPEYDPNESYRRVAIQPRAFHPGKETVDDYIKYVRDLVQSESRWIEWIQDRRNLKRDVVWLLWKSLEHLTDNGIANRWADRQDKMKKLGSEDIVGNSTVNKVINELRKAVDDSLVVDAPQVTPPL